MTAYYNEWDSQAAAWLRELIRRGHIAPGDVDERSITDVQPEELKGYTQHHFFAGIGGWSLALRSAGWPDARPVFTGSPPCQPFSAAGRGGGYSDERHLAPQWLRLVKALRPAFVFGEQVAAAVKKDDWLDDLLDELEAENYATGAVVLPACGVGAPHIRQRLWVVARLADSGEPGLQGRQHDPAEQAGQERSVPRAGSSTGGVEISGNSGTGHQCREVGKQRWGALDGRSTRLRQRDGTFMSDRRHADGETDGMADSGDSERDRRGEERAGFSGVQHASDYCESIQRPSQTQTGWDDPDWLYCRDGKWRPVKSGTFPLADGLSARVGRLRGYGNAIVPQVAEEIIREMMRGDDE